MIDSANEASRLKSALCICALLAVSVPVSAQSELGWQHYQEPGAGYALRYPADVFKPDPSKTSPAGRVFVTGDGSARLLIGSLENVDQHTPASYQKFISSESYDGARIDYAPVGGSWTVVSGTRDDKTFYQKVIFSCAARTISTFALTYPTSEKAFFDPIVEEIEDSFKPVQPCQRPTAALPE